jgi:endonuclease-8
MPEGPEMFRVARRVADVIQSRPLNEVWFAFDHLKGWSERLGEQEVCAVETRGKALLIRFDDGLTIYTHNQLYGRWMFSAADRRPDTRRQLRLALSTSERSALLYSASEIEVIEPDQMNAHPLLGRGGLDLLSSGASVDEIADWISQPRFARRALGHLLLDQSFLAGVGNYLRSEILYVAGLHWSDTLKRLSAEQISDLAQAAHTMMWRSVKTGGVTNDPERVKALKKAGWRRRDYRHYVFSREGQACFECDRPIARETVSGRRLYSCPACQKRD